ncbi:di-heme oxidoredictase family protein [Microvirga puerhi]|uniref:Cytochrome c domain-containing protein n=1 Tax=Microvirga puerhi TaxID=2876078 RepID=A0ABS7VT70_9HYPH|nr:di-heme oxidoredictase family protein [Microvirga puerhi]MBZ6078755.1 hypothetical protein [Microvirga puerhi]
MMKRRAWLRALVALPLLAPIGAAALDEVIGRALFRRAWVPAPSSTHANDGLGPLFNARSCAACHHDLDRTPVQTNADGAVSSDHLVLRFSDAAGNPDPVYGRQMQSAAVAGVRAEGRVMKTEQGYKLDGLAYGDLGPTIRIGALQAPSLRGLGELETVPATAIAKIAADNAGRSDGVRGRVNWVTDAQGARQVGRFGWKASQPTLMAQVETAFLLDLGLSSKGHPLPQGDCTARQTECLAAPMGDRDGGPEISPDIVSRIVAYLAEVGARSAVGGNSAGLASFEAIGCAACHRPSLPGTHGPVQAFTDLLLHDLGSALDGGATEPGVASTEWRTAPLWGLSRTLANGAGLMHDGRARTVEDAIDLHGGEAAFAKTRFKSLPEAERRRLIAFLTSL